MRYVAVCARQIRFVTACENAARSLNLTLAVSLLLNLNFVLADLLLNFIIAGAAD
ncbi:hypothetical protein [uncultured Campylobacter sp.]|uniref:hypothetical protein n=1 Tax=uncultured Campylobacter sp. TaxID=218934 RepID=UPI002618B95D|nr:hypothetical protein [uncultured Campylobacter sp.]